MHKKIQKQNIKHYLAEEKGLTLIDLAIALIVIGLLATPALYALKQYKIVKAENDTLNNLQAVETALEDYHIANDFYPCPANPNISRNAAPPNNFGVPAITPGTSNCLFITGAVPYEELGLDVENIFDGYGNKINYSVTNGMAGSTTPPTSVPTPIAPAGALTLESIPQFQRPGDCATVCLSDIDLTVWGGTPNLCTADLTDLYPLTPLVQTTGIHYTLFSSGSDGAGAFNESGIQTACNTGTASDDENCDGDTTFRADVNRCLFADTNTALRFDDFHRGNALQKNIDPSETFETSTVNPNAIGTTANYTGINNDDPQHELDVIGSVRISDVEGIIGDDKNAAAHSDEYCDPTGTFCFDSNLIGGRDPRMQCGSFGMAGISNNRANCPNHVDDSTRAAASCTATARKVTSLTIGGTYECAP